MYKMRGELCIGFASVLSLVSLILLIFVHVGQINTSSVPRKIYMAHLNTSAYEGALESSTGDPFDLYALNASAPLAERQGLRHNYYFGLYTYCGYMTRNDSATEGECSDHVLGHRYEPAEVMFSDLEYRAYIITRNVIEANVTFTDTKYTGQSSKAAYWMILLGTICAGLAFVTGIPKSNYTFFISTIFAIAGSILLLVGASIWTVLVKRTQEVNVLRFRDQPVDSPLELHLAVGQGIYILWAAFGSLAASVIPYMISCCTWRG